MIGHRESLAKAFDDRLRKDGFQFTPGPQHEQLNSIVVGYRKMLIEAHNDLRLRLDRDRESLPDFNDRRYRKVIDKTEELLKAVDEWHQEQIREAGKYRRRDW